MIRASGPSLSRDAMAPSTLVARSYSNAAGVCNTCSFSNPGDGRSCVPNSTSYVFFPDSGLAWVVARRLALRKLSARCPDVVALFVLHGRVGADHGRPRQGLRALMADVVVQGTRRQAAALDVPENRTCRIGRRDRRLPPEPRQRERALRVDLADARRRGAGAAREAPETGGRGAG